MMMAAERALDFEMQSVRRAPVLSQMPTMVRRRTFLAGLLVARSNMLRSLGHLGQDCPEGYFYDEFEGECLIQTQQLANTYVDPATGRATLLAPTQYYPSIYGPSVSPVGVECPGQQPLDAAVRAAIEGAGHTIDCRMISDEYCIAAYGESECGCRSMLCSVDGEDYSRGAYAINANPGVLLVELGAGAPLFPAAAVAPAAPGAVPQVPQPAVTQPGTVPAKDLSPATGAPATHVMTEAAKEARLPAVLTTPISVAGFELSPLLLAAGVGLLLLMGKK